MFLHPFADVSLQEPCICRARTLPRDAKEAESMIQLTRLNNKPLLVNSDLIKFVEQSPDTLVTLITGEKIVVLERCEEVVARVIEFRRAVLQGLSPAWDASSSHSPLTGAADRDDPESER
jgi:flagellar protein FlbD